MLGLIVGLIAATRLPGTAYCSGVSPVRFPRSIGVENVCPHCAKPGEFHTARAFSSFSFLLISRCLLVSFGLCFLKFVWKGYVSVEILPVVILWGKKGAAHFTVGQGLRPGWRNKCPECLWDLFSDPQSWQASREPSQALVRLSALLPSHFLQL